MSSTEHLLVALADNLTSPSIITRDLLLKVEHASGKVDTDIVSIVQNAPPSEVTTELWKTAKGNMTRMEKAGLALHLQTIKAFREPIPLVNKESLLHEAELADALKHPETLDDDADAFLAKYHDLYAGNSAVRIKIFFDKSTFYKLGRAAVIIGSAVLHICLDT